ncbi:MAG: type II secretion system minor pseudopilin GspI [Thiolinea sp.]
MMRKASLRPAAGFSLVEVMFALFLIVLVIGIASQVASNSVRNANAMKEATFARWVGLNQLELYQMAVDAGTAGSGNDEGDEAMGDRQWHWVREVSPSSADALLEVKVLVYRTDDTMAEDPSASVKGYIKAR